MERKIEDLLKEYTTIRKRKSQKEEKLKTFQEKLKQSMPFWPENVEEVMNAAKKGKLAVEVEAIDEDLEFLRSMKSDRIAQYSVVDKVNKITWVHL